MKLSMRAYQSEEDYWRVRPFLREVYLLNGRHERSWQVGRFDYWRWHGVENCQSYRIEDVMFFWETPEGRLAAVLTPDGAGEAFLQIHPAFRTPELEAEMIAVAEKRLAAPGDDGHLRLSVWADADDPLRQNLLKDCGYTKGAWPEYKRRRSFDLPIPEGKVAEGYTIRALGEGDELPARSWASWRAFHPDEPDEKYEGWTWYHNVRRCPLYRRHLDLGAVYQSEAGLRYAAFCTVWYDDVTRTAMFEPVGTDPEHQRKGLGKAVMYEGLRRAKHMGATLATVGSYSAPAGALYEAVGFTEYDLGEPWEKRLD